MKPRTLTNVSLAISLIAFVSGIIQAGQAFLGQHEDALVVAWLSAASGWGFAAILLIAIRGASDAQRRADEPAVSR